MLPCSSEVCFSAFFWGGVSGAFLNFGKGGMNFGRFLGKIFVFRKMLPYLCIVILQRQREPAEADYR